MAKTGNPLEPMIVALTEAIGKAVDGLPEAKAPLGARKLTDEEQLIEYLGDPMHPDEAPGVRDNPGAWAKIMQEHGMRAAIDYALSMEGKMQKRKGAEVNNGQSEL